MLEIIQYVHVWCCLFVQFGKNRMRSSFCTIWLGVTALGFPQPENVRSTFGNRSPILLNPLRYFSTFFVIGVYTYLHQITYNGYNRYSKQVIIRVRTHNSKYLRKNAPLQHLLELFRNSLTQHPNVLWSLEQLVLTKDEPLQN